DTHREPRADSGRERGGVPRGRSVGLALPRGREEGKNVKEPITIERLTVRYGRATACADVSLAVPSGAVYALLGRNGAGKSSLIRCLLGQQRPSAGRALLFGEDSWTTRRPAMERTGVAPEEPDAPPSMTARE